MGETRFYSVFGLTVEADREIPGLAAGGARPPADLRFETQPASWFRLAESLEPFYASPYQNRDGQPVLRVWLHDQERLYRFVYDDGAEFLIDLEAKRIRARWPESLSIEEIGPYLLGPLLGFALRLRGITCLHASSLVVDGSAVALVGPAGAGKSTTAAAFARRGHSVLTDDIVALVDQGDSFAVNPAYPWLRLWPASVEVLFGSSEALPRIAPEDPEWDKRYLDLAGEGYDFTAEPMSLSAVYVLAARSDEPDAPYIRETSARDRFIALVANTYSNRLLGSELRAREFDHLGRLQRSVPVRVVVPHTSPNRLGELCEVILEDLATPGELAVDPAVVARNAGG